MTENEIKEMMGDHNIFTSFVSLYRGESDPIYLPVEGFTELNKVLTDKLNEYNESKA